MTKNKVGIALISGSMIIFLIDRFTHTISTFLGKLFCGDRYMQPVDGLVGEMSCGFDADMYLIVFLFILFLFGVALLVTARGMNPRAQNKTQ